MRKPGLYERAIKRPIDVLSAAVLLICLLPLLLAVAFAVLVALGRPVFFRERRAGRGGVPFTLWKFRTMTSACGPDGRVLPDADRLTPLGRVLRRTSLDELPELLQVLTGELSLVGPRPLPVVYVPRYSAAQARRLEVTPGITGLAQVHGRNTLEWDERFALDAWYVDHLSASLDVQILLRTVLVVIRREGISHPGHVTMHEFIGSIRSFPRRGDPHPAPQSGARCQ